MADLEDIEFDVWDLDLKNIEGEWELHWRADTKEELFFQFERLTGRLDCEWVENSAFIFPKFDGQRDFNTRIVQRHIGSYKE